MPFHRGASTSFHVFGASASGTSFLLYMMTYGIVVYGVHAWSAGTWPGKKAAASRER